MRGKKAADKAPTQNPRPVQHRRHQTESPQVAALKIEDTPLSHAFRRIEPRWRNYIYYADLAAKAGDEEMGKFMRSYKALPKREQLSVMPEAVCELAGIAPSDLVASVSRELWNHKQSESTISASVDHPRVIEQTALFAITRADAYKDRELFLRATGTLPDKKGASIVINNTPQSNNLSVSAHAGVGMFKSMDQSVAEMSKLLDEPIDVNAVPLSDEEADSVFEDSYSSED